VAVKDKSKAAKAPIDRWGQRIKEALTKT